MNQENIVVEETAVAVLNMSAIRKLGFQALNLYFVL